MWNVFDTSFVIIFLLYTILRIKGLATNDGEFRILVWVLKLKGRSSLRVGIRAWFRYSRLWRVHFISQVISHNLVDPMIKSRANRYLDSPSLL